MNDLKELENQLKEYEDKQKLIKANISKIKNEHKKIKEKKDLDNLNIKSLRDFLISKTNSVELCLDLVNENDDYDDLDISDLCLFVEYKNISKLEKKYINSFVDKKTNTIKIDDFNIKFEENYYHKNNGMALIFYLNNSSISLRQIINLFDLKISNIINFQNVYDSLFFKMKSIVNQFEELNLEFS